MGTIALDDLSVFVTVAETASFSLAAARLGMPKSSVSRAVTRIEEVVGARVFHRTTRQVTLSTVGMTLHERVRDHIHGLRSSVETLPELDDQPSGRLRISAPLSFDAVLAPVVAGFTSRYSAVEVELRFANRYVDIVAEGVDLALRFAIKRMKDSSFTARKLAPSVVHLYASPGYVARRGQPRSPADLEAHDWVVFSVLSHLRLEGGGPAVEVAIRGRIDCDSLAFVRAALVCGCGIGYLHPDFAAAEVAGGRLIRILPRWQSQVSTLWAVWPGGRLAPRKVSAFVELLEEELEHITNR